MESVFKDWSYIEGLINSAYHEAALKMKLSDSEMSILYVFNAYQEGCNQSVLYKESCLKKSTKFGTSKDGKRRTSLCNTRNRAEYTGVSHGKRKAAYGKYRIQNDRD